jgi:hypothetical protein
MNAGTAILLSLWSTYADKRTDTSLGFVDALEQAVSALRLSHATAIVEELENELIVYNRHAQSLADYIRKVKSV